MTQLARASELPQILNISSAPTPTGNNIGLGHFLVDPNGDNWFVAQNGQAIKLTTSNGGNSFYMDTNTTPVTVSTARATVILTTAQYTIKKGKRLKIKLEAPCFLNAIPSGIIFNCNVKVNDEWLNLGNNGSNGFLYAYQDYSNINTSWIFSDIMEEDYTIVVEFTALTTGATAVTVNGGTNKINTIEKGLGARGAVYNPQQNFLSSTIEEF